MLYARLLSCLYMHACVYICIGFPGDSVTKNQSANAGNVGWILGPEDPLENEMATLSSALSTKSFTHTHTHTHTHNVCCCCASHKVMSDSLPPHGL